MAKPSLMNADLHCHSHWSDGVLAPEALVQRAIAGKVDLFAITDHDEVGSSSAARAAAKQAGLAYLSGVEISVSYSGETIHIVGLGIDPNHPQLVDGLQRTRSGRDARAKDMGQQLAAVGIPGAYEGALKHAGNPNLVSRTHFARFLVETKVCSEVREVFGRYLVPGKPGFVEQRWAGLEEAIRWIIDAGGVAVMAHPARYRIGDLEKQLLIESFKDLGGEGIEVVCGSHTAYQYEEYAKVSQRFGLLASRGSDFHSPDESHMDIGALPPLPPHLDPVWLHPKLLQHYA